MIIVTYLELETGERFEEICYTEYQVERFKRGLDKRRYSVISEAYYD